MSKKLIQAAAGAAGGEPVYAEDVFSTYLYDGNGGTTQSFTNNINFADEGGLVWIKSRTDTGSHIAVDTERGGDYQVYINSDVAQDYLPSRAIGFNTDGFSVSNDIYNTNKSGQDYTSWSFRKQKGFFDVVTFEAPTVADTNYRISHSLGSAPGTILLKNVDAGTQWYVYHRIEGRDKYLVLNSNVASASSTGIWGTSDPTSTDFGVKVSGSGVRAVNVSSGTYIAYLFAHDDQRFGDDSDESIIKCGNFDGAANTEINLGWEPQWVLWKNASSTPSWGIIDNMRGWYTGENDAMLIPNLTNSEDVTQDILELTSTGFVWKPAAAGNNYIYVAIRRPMKTPEAATEVFNPIAVTTTTPTTSYTVGFPADFLLQGFRTLGISARAVTRMLGTSPYLETQNTGGESFGFGSQWDLQDDYAQSAGISTTVISWFFKRATGFFDVVAYTGNATSNRDINHNLGVTPELMIVKARDSTQNWVTYDSDTGATKYMRLNTSAQPATTSGMWNNTAPTATVFTVDGTGGRAEVNASSTNYIAYLFASVAGVSKIGVYTGTGSNVNVDCGFSAGARFILIKRNNDSGDWYVYDSARGIVAGNDPYLLLNSTAAEVTSTDYIDPLSSGFTVTSSAPAGLNASGGTYIFLAIA